MARIEAIEARAYTVATDAPEPDGTASWQATTIVVVHARGGGRDGVGYTCSGAWRAMQAAVRNLGRAGPAATGVSAVDTALWDLKAKLLDVPLASLLGRFGDAVPIYGSGGFTSHDNHQPAQQLSGWVDRDGCRWVEMKIGREPERPGLGLEFKRRDADAHAA